MTVAKNHSVPQPLVINVSNTDIDLSSAQLERLQSDNPDLQLELTEDGKLVVRPLEVAEHQQAVSVEQESSTHKGAYNLVEMTPEETAKRVAAFDRFREGQRQRWESLTSEEQAQSDRQFDELYKFLEESRR